MSYIISRSDGKAIKRERHWILLYGRRKVGKTFLLRELCKFRNYYTIKKDHSIISPGGVIPAKSILDEIKILLSSNKTVVIDEFQRLDESLLEDMSLLHPKGKLILSGSSMRVIKKVFDPKSPLLGSFTPIKIGFIQPSDMIINLYKEFKDDQLLELSTFLREPWAIPIYNGENTLDFVYKLVTQSRQVITALIGEIFTEEERELSRRYESIIALIGAGVWKTNEITSMLFSRNLIPNPSPNHVIQYLNNLEEMGLVESIKLHRAKGRYYRLVSPIMNIYYYLDSRYDISERPVSLEEIKPTLQKLVNLEIQNFVADLFSELYGGRKEYFVSGDREVDFVITKRNKAEMVCEVKWKIADRGDVDKFIRNAEGLSGRRIMVCKGSSAKEHGIEIIDTTGLVSMVQKMKRSKGK